MASLLDSKNGKASIAYVGQTPWHKSGQLLTPGQPIETWRVESGMDFDVLESDVYYMANKTDAIQFPARKALYRSDNNAPLSIVSKDYKLVQPSQVLNFFDELCKLGGFDLEVAGVLDGGRRVWGLAKVSDGAPVIGQDVVKPYVLMATSFDGTMATLARFTSVRVVCNNTLTMSLREGGHQVKVPHNMQFSADKMRDELGIVTEVYQRWMEKVKEMAATPLVEAEAENFALKMMAHMRPSITEEKDLRALAGYSNILDLYHGKGLIGSDIDGGFTRWRMMNVITQNVDHERGSEKTRLSSAWFGIGETLKNKAFELLTA